MAEQISDYLLTGGAIVNALNMPSISADEAKGVGPWITLAQNLGAFAGQLTETSIAAVDIIYEGSVAALNTRALTQAALCGLLKPALSGSEHGQRAVDRKGARHSRFRRFAAIRKAPMKAISSSPSPRRRISAASPERCFRILAARMIQVKDINMEAEFAPHMLYHVTNEDKPGFIGKLGTLLGNAHVNIARFQSRPQRAAPTPACAAIVQVDEAVPAPVLQEIRTLLWVKQARALVF